MAKVKSWWRWGQASGPGALAVAVALTWLGSLSGTAPTALTGVAAPRVEDLLAPVAAITSPALAPPGEPAAATAPSATATPPDPSTQARIESGYGRLPMHFEPNLGQHEAAVQFSARGLGYQIFLTPDEAVLVLRSGQAAPSAIDQAAAAATAALTWPTEGVEAAIPSDRTALVATTTPTPTTPGAVATPDPGAAPGLARDAHPYLQDPAHQPRPGTGRVDATPPDGAPSAVVRMRLAGAARNVAPKIEGLERLPGHSNYFLGKEPAQWRTQAPHFGKVKYSAVYPGIDLVYYGNPQQLEYDFVLAPGADPGLIQVAFEGARQVRVAANGDLILSLTGGELVQQAPRIYQDIDGERRLVEGRYVLRSAEGEAVAFQPDAAPNPARIGFQIASYQPELPLVIDPVLIYATYLGGSSYDYGSAIALDGEGNAYVTGFTPSADFPTTHDVAYPNSRGSYDAFIAKLNADGTALVYATYLGGSQEDYGVGIAVDGAGNAYVTGSTFSDDFPTSGDAAYPAFRGGENDVFIAKFNADGTALVYATYLGGSSYDYGSAIALGGEGNAYVTGYTDSGDFPTTLDAAYPISRGGDDAFVAKLDADGTALVYATYLGGSQEDYGVGIAVDGAGNAYVTGDTYSSDFPTRLAPYPNLLGSSDAFVTALPPNGTTLVYATYLGGSSYDYGSAIALDGEGNAYVTGSTDSDDFPTTLDTAYPNFQGGINDAFIAKLNTGGTVLVYATYLGGSDSDNGKAIAVDTAGIAYVTGDTYSSDFPTHSAPYPNLLGSSDAFVTALPPNGTTLVYATYLGGSSSDSGGGIALDSVGNAYVTGSTDSDDFPTTPGAFKEGLSYADAFISKIGLGGDLLLVSRTGAGSGRVTSDPAGIDCGDDCSENYPQGQSVTLTATPDPHFAPSPAGAGLLHRNGGLPSHLGGG